MTKILIFDLDETISENCFNNEKHNILLQVLQKANLKKWKTYVVTARPSKWVLHNVFKQKKNDPTEEKTIMEYRINKYIVEALRNNRYYYYKNNNDEHVTEKGKKIVIDRWLYYFDKPYYEYAREHFKQYKNIDITSIIKWLQIVNIKKKNPSIQWNDVYFFDDAQYHRKAFKTLVHLFPGMEKMHFIGGTNECVFNNNTKILRELLDEW